MKHEKTKTPMWFWILSTFFLLWNVLGLFSFLAHTFITDEALATLPANERELYGEYPLWTTIVFAIAVVGGMIGSVGLVFRRKWSQTAFVISLLAIIPQMIQNVFFTTAIEVYGTVEAVTMPVLVVFSGLFLVWFSMLGNRKKWLN